MRKFFRKLILKERASSEDYIAYLRKLGVSIGEQVRFYSPSNTVIDTSCPCLLSIGNNVSITHGVIILTHDYSWSVIKQLPDSAGEILGGQSPVKIGNNVFIGMNAIITRGVTVGDNVIIGAGSIVTSDCDNDSVYAGNPARKIMTVQQYREKRRRKQMDEAKTLVMEYRKKFNADPPQEMLSEYFMLFCKAEDAKNNPAFLRQMKTGGNFDECYTFAETHPPAFNGYQEFLAACDSEGQV